MSDTPTKTEPLPSHIAIIMDGNRRWAKARGMNAAQGHQEGYKRFKEVVDSLFEKGVKYLTVYAFSTENWKRDTEEVGALMNLARFVMEKEVDRYRGRNIKINIMGRASDYPDDIARKAAEINSDTASDTGGTLNIAFSYGGRAEIVEAVNHVIQSGEEVTEESISENLYTAGQPDPELVIRTGGDPRLSNFLVWQSYYSEIYFTDTLWPDFDGKEVVKALDFYSTIKRNFGR